MYIIHTFRQALGEVPIILLWKQ